MAALLKIVQPLEPVLFDDLEPRARERLGKRGQPDWPVLAAAMALGGAISGETLSPARSRWTITRTGLAAVFGKPVVILNDVQARSWAIKSGSAATETLRGVGAPSLGRPGRYIMMMVEEGVGAAVIDVDRNGIVHILETEGGHMDFAPGTERENKLARAVKGLNPHVSWEMMLMLERNAAVWSACSEIADVERPRMLANMLGRFAVNLMHAFGAWNGVLITGSRAGRMLEAGARAAFDAAFNERRNFSRLVIGSPAWKVEQREAVLIGAAECLAQNIKLPLQRAA